MAHYAFLDSNNVVTEVIVGVDETELIEGLTTEMWYGNYRGQICKRTSYNNKIRKQFCAIGFRYLIDADVFIKPQPFGSWTLDSNHDWQPPTPKPDGNYLWNELRQEWTLNELN